MYLFYVLVIICVCRFTSARLELTVTSGVCSNYYYMEDIEEAFVTYKGASLSDGCYIKFINWDTFQKKTCIKPTSLNLDCSTKIEYHRHFISEYTDPDVLFSCNNVSYNEWCGNLRTSNLYIVFKTSRHNFVDNVKLHVYLKDVPKEDDPWSKTASHSSSVAIIVSLVVGVAVLTIIITCVIVCVIIQKRRSAQRPQFAYQTTTSQINMQTGAAQVQPQHLPPQQQTASGNYQWHPMQSAFPVSMQQGNSNLASNQLAQQQAPSAPSNDVAAPPPSYESVRKM